MMMTRTGLRSLPSFAHARRSVVVVRAAASAEPRSITFAERRVLWAEKENYTPEEKRAPRPENVDGDFFVDASCIDCMTCRWVAPDTFSAVGLQAAVTEQPKTPEQRQAALQALYSCPVFSIHVRQRDGSEIKAAQKSLPRPWLTEALGVYHCGWHSEASFGGAGWLLTRPGGRGNVLVDAPRFNPALAKGIEELGGIEYIFLTHKDDVADHAKWAKHFGAKRIIHQNETTDHQGTKECEIQITGEGPTWAFPDGDDDLTLIATPGHTEHHVVLHSKRHKALFSGDHLSGAEYSDSHWKMNSELFIFTEANWYSVPEQLRSVQKLLDYDWLHVLPGHGVPARVADAAERLRSVSDLLERHAAVAQA